VADVQLDGVWQAGYHVGTVGAATTAQVKAFLKDEANRAKSG
jgi:REP element-mobilizing transposase RayT